jgi:hypothetical protein
MGHFSEQAWVDFIREFEQAERPQMELHLTSACGDCTQIHDTWKRVHTAALRESLYAPPASAVRLIKLEFAARQSGEVKPPVFANLTFDTFAKPALAGIRSAAASARQMLYETEGLAVDLRFDRPPTGNLVHVTGQVLDKQQPHAALESVLVIVWTPKGLPVAETRANAFGEFNFQLEPQNHLRLSIQTAGRKPVSISLANLGTESRSDGTEAVNDGNQ